MARFLATAVLPVMIYFTIFHIHIGLIPNAGDHDLAVSGQLRYSLEGNHHEPVQKGWYPTLVHFITFMLTFVALDIAFGSSVVLRHLGSNGGYLHSHLRRYAEGSTRKLLNHLVVAIVTDKITL